MSAVIDPTKAAKYPVVLSDALLGGPAKNLFTNLRYNHKPELSSDSSPEQARLKPALPDSTSSYELSFQDGDAKYAYAGTRTIGGNQYILYFDPSRKVFVLDKVDSTFNLNLTRTPETSDPESLRQRYEHLGAETTSIVAARPEAPTATPTPAVAAAAKPAKPAPPKRKVVPKKPKKEGDRPKGLSVVEPPRRGKEEVRVELEAEAEKKKKKKKAEAAAKASSKKRRGTPESEEDDDDDDDDDLLQVEYPDGESNSRHNNDFSPAFPEKTFPLRRFSDFAEELRESGNELDDERSTPSDTGLNNFKLPSPVGKGGAAARRVEEYEEDDDDDDDDDEVEMEDVQMPTEDSRAQRDLAAELEAGLESELEAELEAGLEAGLESELEAHLSAGLEGKASAETDLERDLAAELENGLMMANSGHDADSESEVSEED